MNISIFCQGFYAFNTVICVLLFIASNRVLFNKDCIFEVLALNERALCLQIGNDLWSMKRKVSCLPQMIGK